MKELKMIFILIAVFLYSCAGSVKNAPLNPATSTSSSPSENLLEYYDTNLGDPDTSLAIFLYKHHQLDKDWEGHLEAYIRWDLEYPHISSLLHSLFGSEPGFDRAKRNLDEKKLQFVHYARNQVEEDLNEFHGVSGMLFNFLVERKDSTVISTLERVIVDPLAPEDEVRSAREILEELNERN